MQLRLLVIVILASVQTSVAQIAVKADSLFTAAGPLIRNGVVLLNGGKIEQVGAGITIPANYKVIEAKVVTPGLVDARSVVGLSGPLNTPADQDQLEKSNPLQPELRAIDAYNSDDMLVTYLRSNGVTTIHTGHGVGALISGQTMVAKTKKGTTEEVTVVPLAMIAMSVGADVKENFTSPATSSKAIAMIRAEFIKAQGYVKKSADKDSSKRPAADLKLDMLSRLLNREIKALVFANTSRDIINSIRLAKEFNLRLVIEGGAEAYRVIDEIKSAQAEVILHPTMFSSSGDRINLNRESAAILQKAGIPVIIESGYEAYVPKTRLVLYEAAIAMTMGLSYEEAIKAITIRPARLLGLDNRIGSIEKGKDADLVLYSGDPFEYLSKVCTVIIDGEIVAENCE